MEQFFLKINKILKTRIPVTLRCLTITFLMQPRTSLLDDEDVEELSHLLEDVVLTLDVSHVTFGMPRAKENRLAFWSEIIYSRFPRLYEGGLLEVRCSSGALTICVPLNVL